MKPVAVVLGIGFVAIALALSACGSDPGSAATAGLCASAPSIGTGWKETNSGSSLELRADCTASESECGDFTFTAGTATKITVKTALGGDRCLPQGTHDCGAYYSMYGNQERLSFACSRANTYREYRRGTP